MQIKVPWCGTQDCFVFWKLRGGELSQDAAPDWHRKLLGHLAPNFSMLQSSHL